MEKLLMLIGNAAEDSEFIYPYYRFQEESYKIVVLGARESR
jgi:putative intracellular protease/amidase